MADNTTLNTGSGGDTIASDDIGGVKYPRSKIVIGADNVNDGDVSSANPLPVTGTVTANLGATDNAVLDAIAASVAGTLTVGSHAVTNAGTFAVQVNGDALTALQLIDNAVSGAGFNITQFAGAAVPIGAGVEATAVRVTLATDSTGVVSVDDNGSTISIDDGGGAITVDGTVAVTGTFWQATQPVSGTVTANAGSGTFTVSGAVTNTVLSVVGNGAGATAQRVTLADDSTGIISLTTSTASIGRLAANSGVDIGDVDILSIAAGTNLVGDVGLQPRTSGGLTMHKTTSAASTNATAVKGSAGQVYSVQCFNVNAAVRYLKLYNKATAPTVGTDTPVKTLAIPGNTAGAGFVIGWPQGLAFGTGIGFALTTEATDAGTTGVALNEITVNLDYA